MAYVAIADRDAPIHDPHTFFLKYIWSQDHKVIAIQYSIVAIFVGLVALVRDRLLDQDVLACFDRLDAPVCVHADREWNVDRVDVGIREELLEGSVGSRDPVLLRVAPEVRLRVIFLGDGHDVDAVELARMLQHGKGGNSGGPQDSEAKGFGHLALGSYHRCNPMATAAQGSDELRAAISLPSRWASDSTRVAARSHEDQ